MKHILLFVREEQELFLYGLSILFLCVFCMRIYYRFVKQKKIAELAQKASQLRMGQDGVRVRQTDLIERMDRQAKAVYREAEALEQQGNFIEAANLFESINFQRRAIDILEQRGFIEQACEILIRLNSPGRAAIVSERNQRDDLAAKYYIAAGQHDKAGNALLRLAAKDYHYYEKAAACFEKSHHVLGLLRSLGPLLKSQRIKELCFESGHFDFLIQYLRDPVNARSVLPSLTDDQLRALFDAMPLSPETVQTVINWVYYDPDDRLYRLALRFAGQDVFMCRLFWHMTSADLAKKLYEQLLYIYEDIGVDNCINHVDYFEAARQFERAAVVAEKVGEIIRAAKLRLQMNDIVRCHQLLERHGYKKAAGHLAEILDQQPQGPWTVDQLDRARHYVEESSRKTLPLDLSKAPSAA